MNVFLTTTYVYSHFKLRKLRHREVKELAQDRAVRKWQIPDLKPAHIRGRALQAEGIESTHVRWWEVEAVFKDERPGARGRREGRRAGETVLGEAELEMLGSGSPLGTRRWPPRFPALCLQVLAGRMLLFWGSLLCWGLLPQAQGQARHLLFLRVSKDQLETGKI